MKLRQVAFSIAAVSALAAAPSFAQSVIVEPDAAPATTYVAPTTPDVVVVPAQPNVVIVPAAPDAVTSPGYVYDPSRNAIVTEQGGMTPQERRDTAGTADRATGAVTSPGYMGPHDSKGQ